MLEGESKMKNLKKKLICNIYEFMGIEEVQYGSRELFFRNIIKEILVVLIFWGVSLFFLWREEYIFIRELLIWLVLFLPFEIVYFISIFFFLKKDKSDQNRRFKENFFFICLVLFVIFAFPYFLLSKIAKNSEFQNLFEYGHVFIFEIISLIYLYLVLVSTWTSSDKMKYVDMVFIIFSCGFFGLYLLLRSFIRWVFIRKRYNRCEYILEYSALVKGLNVIGSLILAVLSFYSNSKEMVIVLIIYILLETVLESLRRNKRKYDLVLTLFKETLFVLNKVMPTVKNYDILIIKLKYSVDEKVIENYATLYKTVNNTQQGKELQDVMDMYYQLLGRKYDCTQQQNWTELHNNITDALNTAAKYLQSCLS